ncbi:MAG: efflux RND transporter periplasmic adaptor subunit [Treponema sp.]|jgi:multidrug efflux pump subunit AcrA (membrane-fusion protein)|nr:efflux RND transporter periplasmic adaptor subunit [Treponema sp.]
MNKTGFLQKAVFFTVVISFMGCKNGDAAKAVEDVPVFAVNTTTAVQGQVWDYLSLSGDIVAGSTVDVYSDVAGKVTRLYVEVGNHVNRGSPVVAVDPSKPGMNYVPGVATAPISGTVTLLPAQIGMTVTQAMPLAKVSGGDALEIKLHVAERFISRVALAQPCEVSLDAWPGEVFRGSVGEVSPVVDPASRTMEVKVNVTNQDGKLKEGMFAKVRVITEQKESTVKIPATALIQRFGEEYVYVVEEFFPSEKETAVVKEKKGFFASIFSRIASVFGRKEEVPDETPVEKQYSARKRIVKPGISIDGVLEIESGLKAGESIIVKGQTLINDASRINIIEKVAPLSISR